MNLAPLLIPGGVLLAGFVACCLTDLARAAPVRFLPKWGWAILCLGIGLSIPCGGFAYLIFGKMRSPKVSPG